ncbi:MAG: sensor histidine kinase [Rhodoluna sp.]
MREKKWLPALSVAGICLLVFGGADLILQGWLALPATFVLVSSVALSRQFPWMAIGLAALGLFISPALGLDPQLSQLAASVSLLMISIFHNSLKRLTAFSVSVVTASASLIWQVFSNPKDIAVFSVLIPSTESKLLFTFVGILTVLALNANALLLGRLIETRLTHVGTGNDIELLEKKIATAEHALAEQDKRFGIARDVSEILLEQTSANLVAVESGGYAIKSNPAIADRVLETLATGISDAFKELRRLSDLLSLQEQKSVALPGLRDLIALFVSYREKGYQVTVRQTGESLDLSDGAELVIYRVVADSLENINKHAPIGTGVDIDFIWKDKALQILIKDNGEETARVLGNQAPGYSVDEDQKALVEHISGPSLTAMADRVALFEGAIEFTRVPGVGFTVSTAFPDIAKYARR